MMQSRAGLFWTTFSVACRTKWWLVIVWANVVIYLLHWATHSVPTWVMTVDGLVLLAGCAVILTRTFVRYRRARKQDCAPSPGAAGEPR